ncbi:MAG: tyrosine-type recombinase/integrase [Gloeomargarita sp. SKYG116]|nr:tyrosine-type recombinase/integrase [Gloeomargarita sp. SKYG116]MCS7226663.1 tyrosine-type recombinase/integrase [Gloeomargarita sp. SKYB31]MDW8402341.1 tyrosine-type recombinase/integrase [Gloeomargarita sp. SKYGB_i_bin116]
MGKTPKGNVGIHASNGRLQLRWTWNGKRYCLSPGLPDTPLARKGVKLLVATIERDLAYGMFDGDTSKYKPKPVKPQEPPKPVDLRQLWVRYEDFRRPQVSLNTLGGVYRQVRNALRDCPYGLNEPVKVRDWLVSHHPPDACKRILTRLSACCRWAVQSGLLDRNPFQGMTSLIRVPKATRQEIDPFTPQERDVILDVLDRHPTYRHYRPLVQFLFLTGCRPGEALGLEWAHIHDGYIHFQQSAVVTHPGTVKPGLKTQASRRFPINRQLQALLDSIPQTSRWVFPSPTGRLINQNNFSRRVWPAVLAQAGVRYRRLYNTRHSFITWALQKGLPVQDVAKLCGNSPGVIYSNYAGCTRNLVVPEL